MKRHPDADAFIARQRFSDPLTALRMILIEEGLEEDIKWGKPCYGLPEGGNVAILQPFKDFAAVMFFKGVLLRSGQGLLVPQGANSNAALRAEFTTGSQVDAAATGLREVIGEAMAVERAGLRVPRRDPGALGLLDELVDALDADPELAAAWRALTPGRQRAWVLHIAGAKQSATRKARIARAVPAIMAGKGWNERA